MHVKPPHALMELHRGKQHYTLIKTWVSHSASLVASVIKHYETKTNYTK